MENTDFARLARVALGGAITAVAADFIYTNYGESVRGLVAEILSALENSNTPEAPQVDVTAGGGA